MSYLTRVYMHPDVEAVQGENTLAAWDARWPEWVDDLLEAGKLTQSRSDNFPSLYRGLARDVLPILPEVKRPKISAYYTPEMLQERIAQCPPDAELGIMIWDMG